MSAHEGEGIERLEERIADELVRRLQPVELLLPYSEGGRLAELHDIAGELERSDTAEGVVVKALLPAEVAARFERFALNGASRNGADASP